MLIFIIFTQQSSAQLPPYQVQGLTESTPGINPQPTQPQIGGIPGTSCPNTADNTNGFSCKYLNPAIDIFNTNISQAAITKYIDEYSPIFINSGKGDINEFTRRVNYIVSESQKGQLNPAIFLGYWKSESLFSTQGSQNDLGCSGNTFEEQVRCALGIEDYSDPTKDPIANCARSRDANSIACKTLKSIRSARYDKDHPISYPISSFDDFAEAYGPYDDLDPRSGLPTNCTHTYNIILGVAEELNSCQAGTQPLPTPSLSPTPLPDDIAGKIDLIQQTFKINFNGFDYQNAGLSSSQFNQDLSWALEDLNLAKQVAPNFDSLLTKDGVVYIKLGAEPYNYRSGQTVYFGANNYFFTTESFFKQNFIHELTHVINNGQPGENGVNLWNQAISKEGYISQYSSTATPGDVSLICTNSYPISEEIQYMAGGQYNPNDEIYQYINARDDEDFSESVAYFITSFYSPPIPEMPYGNSSTSPACSGIKNSGNPFSSGRYPLHTTFIKKILGAS